MLVSVRPLVVALALLTGCMGVVGETQTDYEGANASDEDEDEDDGNDESDEGDGRADATRTDAGDDDEDNEDGDDADEAGDAEPDGPDAEVAEVNRCGGDGQPLASGLRIREIALYQAVKIPLLKGGAWVAPAARDAPVIQGKKALVRVFVDTLPGYQPHAVSASLTLQGAAGSTVLNDERTITTASTDAQLASTFSFELEGSQVAGDTALSVSLEELECGEDGGAAADARFPAAASQPLEASLVGKLRVVIVPVTVGGRAPVTSEEELATMRAALLAYYPVPDVELTVRNPIAGPSSVAGTDSSGWSNVLNLIMRERRSDAPASDVYYFGLMQPAATFGSYCQRGCVLGLAPQTTVVQASAQVALGASFADAQTYETMVHEIGHAHGRGHAPCAQGGQIDGVDRAYPETSGSVVSWGWDSRSNSLKSPMHKDIMGYCQPNWISAYNYKALYERSNRVNVKALIRSPSGGVSSWHHVLLYADGTARWGGSIEQQLPGGELESATVLDEAGSAIGETEVVRIPLSHTQDQFAYIPEPQPGWAALDLGDRVLQLSEILPAL